MLTKPWPAREDTSAVRFLQAELKKNQPWLQALEARDRMPSSVPDANCHSVDPPEDREIVLAVGARLLDATDLDDEPAALVAKLEDSAQGRHWLLERWEDVRRQLRDQHGWLPADQFVFVRLMGKQPIAAIDDTKLNAIFLAWEVIAPGSGQAAWELCRDQAVHEGWPFAQYMEWREISPQRPSHKVEAIAALHAVVNRQVAQLNALCEVVDGRERPRKPAERSQSRFSATC